MVYDLPPDLVEAARLQLNETADVKAAALTSMRAKIADMKTTMYRTDDDFFLRFLVRT